MSLPKEEMIEILQNEIETLKKRLERKEKELEELKKPTLVWFYINGTRRNFFETDVLEIWMDEEETDKEVIICVDNFKVAWSFDKCEAWQEIVKKYNFDVKMTGYEQGMHFSQTTTILRDGTRKDEIKEYENDADWMWNCPMPNNGG